jgi:hypothetical protein
MKTDIGMAVLAFYANLSTSEAGVDPDLGTCHVNEAQATHQKVPLNLVFTAQAVLLPPTNFKNHFATRPPKDLCVHATLEVIKDGWSSRHKKTSRDGTGKRGPQCRYHQSDNSTVHHLGPPLGCH